jgi:uncharacterized peroxidase-related enzyme
MAFIDTVAPEEATGAVAAMYEADRERFGYLPNFTEVFSHRPAVYAAWRRLIETITAEMDPRRYELASVAAARRMRSSYCMLAHGSVLAKRFLGPDVVQALAEDHHSAGLERDELAIMDLADKVARDASSVTPDDIERLRAAGLSDAEISDVVIAAAVRCFFSKALDGLGAEPDARFAALDPGLRDALTIGRAIASA